MLHRLRAGGFGLAMNALVLNDRILGWRWLNDLCLSLMNRMVRGKRNAE